MCLGRDVQLHQSLFYLLFTSSYIKCLFQIFQNIFQQTINWIPKLFLIVPKLQFLMKLLAAKPDYSDSGGQTGSILPCLLGKREGLLVFGWGSGLIVPPDSTPYIVLSPKAAAAHSHCLPLEYWFVQGAIIGHWWISDRPAQEATMPRRCDANIGECISPLQALHSVSAKWILATFYNMSTV